MFPNDMQLPRIAEKVKHIILSLYHISNPLITTLFVGLANSVILHICAKP